MEFLTEHAVVIIGAGAFIIEIVLRKMPKAKPLTKILYDMIGKVVKDEAAPKS